MTATEKPPLARRFYVAGMIKRVDAIRLVQQAHW